MQTTARTSNTEPSTKYDSITFSRGNSSRSSDLLESTNVKNSKSSNIHLESLNNLLSHDVENSQNVVDSDVNEKINTNASNNRLIAWNRVSVSSTTENTVSTTEPEIKSLADININLQDIKPGNRYSFICDLIKIARIQSIYTNNRY